MAMCGFDLWDKDLYILFSHPIVSRLTWALTDCNTAPDDCDILMEYVLVYTDDESISRCKIKNGFQPLFLFT